MRLPLAALGVVVALLVAGVPALRVGVAPAASPEGAPPAAEDDPAGLEVSEGHVALELLDSARSPIRFLPSVEGFVSPFSALPGEVITARVSTEAATYRADVYRLGAYEGAGIRLVHELGELNGTDQGAPSVDKGTGLVVAPWDVSFAVAIPPEWPSGVYVVRVAATEGANQRPSFLPFVVRAATPTAPFLYHTSELTWQAYNSWGGASLYQTSYGAKRGVMVSMDRPLSNDAWMQFLSFELPMIRFLEANGYAVDYAADVDVHADGARLLRYKAILTVGHDEYWTKAMRDNLEAARDAGVHLAFFGANIGYWQVRLAPSTLGLGDARVIESWRDVRFDPRAAAEPWNATVLFRDAPVRRPEGDLLGVQFDSYNDPSVRFDFTVGADAAALFPRGPGTGDTVWQLFAHEWDNTRGASPPGERYILASGTPVNWQRVPRLAEATYTLTPSGSHVFAAGNLGWTRALGQGPDEAAPALILLTRIILEDMAR